VTLNWTADPASSQVTNYNVYRVGQTFTGPWASPTGTTFTNAGAVVNGTQYCYQVSATNASGSSAESAAVCATPKVPVVATPVVPAVPTSLTASAGNAQVTLKWTANPAANDVTNYNVYRVGQTFTGPWASPTATTFTNSGSVVNGTQYCYQVSATNAVGSSAESAAVCATPQAPVTTPTPAPVSGGGLAGDQFYVDPADSAVTAVAALTASGQTSEAAQLETIASQPDAIWLTDDSSGSEATISQLSATAAAAGKVPVLVAYNLPWRDCGSYSAGGASSPADYESFIDGIVGGIAQRKVVIIVEPDALSELSCLPASEQQSYYQLMHYAAQELSTDANASVYVDAGNPGWQSAAVEAAGVNEVLAGTNAAGFAVNVSNFYSTAADITYGTAISQLTAGKHFVIDTSRNGGNVASGLWCNPAGAALGQPPTTATGNPLVDADLWIKPPGESDGTCNGGPSAGTFWLSYALSLITNQP